MQATVKSGPAGREANYGGLSGKARRRRNRSRAQRLYTKQYIDEYLEPKAPSHSDRYIPIRRRSEFLPSAPLPEGVAFVRKEPERELRLGSDDHVDRLEESLSASTGCHASAGDDESTEQETPKHFRQCSCSGTCSLFTDRTLHRTGLGGISRFLH